MAASSGSDGIGAFLGYRTVQTSKSAFSGSRAEFVDQDNLTQPSQFPQCGNPTLDPGQHLLPLAGLDDLNGISGFKFVDRVHRQRPAAEPVRVESNHRIFISLPEPNQGTVLSNLAGFVGSTLARILSSLDTKKAPTKPAGAHKFSILISL